MPKRKSAPAPTAAEPPQPAVGDLVWVLGLGGEALEKPWPAIVRDVDTDGNSVAWPPAQVDGVRSYECDYLDHPSQDSVPDDRLLGFEDGYARVAKSSEWEIKAKNWDTAHESVLALLAEKVDSSGALAIAMGSERSRRTKYEKLLGLDKASAPSKKRKAPAAKPAKKKPAPKKQEPEEEAEAPEPPPKKRGKAKAPPKAPKAPPKAPPKRRGAVKLDKGALEARMAADGWTKEEKPRPGTTHVDKYFVPPGGGKKLRSVLEVARAAYPEFLAGGDAAAAAPSSPRPDTSGDEALARRFAAARAARPKAPAAKPAAKPKTAPPDTSGDEELARRLGAAAQRRAAPAAAKPAVKPKKETAKPKPKARKRRTVVESEDDSEDDEAPPAPPPASPPSDEGDDLYDDENDENDEAEAEEEPPAPPAGGPRFKGGVSSATSEALQRHVAEALETAAEAPAEPEPEPARPGRIAKKARKASAEAPTGDFMAAYRRVREAYGRNWSHVSEAERTRLALLCRDGKPGWEPVAPCPPGPAAGGWGAQPPLTVATSSPHAAAGGWGAQPPLTVATSPLGAAGAGGWGAPGQTSGWPATPASAPLAKRMIVVDNNKVKFLIGKGGATHKGIQDRSGAHVSIPNGPDPFDPARPDPTKPVRTITIRGPTEEAVGAAARDIEFILAEAAAEKPSSPRAEGFGGLCFNCGERHHVRACPQPRRLGYHPSIAPEHRKDERRNWEEAHGEMLLPVARTGAAPPMKVAPPWNPHGLGRACSKTLVVDNSKVGLIIGKGGQTHKGIQEGFGVLVKIPSEADAGDPAQRTITITGPTDEAAAAAASEIESKLAGGFPVSPRAIAPANGGVLQPIASPASFPIAPPWNPAAGAATAPGWGSPPGPTTGGWGSSPAPAATGWAAPPPQGGFTPAPPRATSPSSSGGPAPAATGWAAAPAPPQGGFTPAPPRAASPPSSLGAAGWAAPPPPPRGGFKPAPPPSSTPSGGFNARRAVLKEMPAAAAAPQALDRASPGPGGRGRGSTLPSWMTKGDAPASLTPSDLATERGDLRVAEPPATAPAPAPPAPTAPTVEERGPTRSSWVAAPAGPPPAPAPPAAPRAPSPRGVSDRPPSRNETRVPDSTDPAVRGRPEAPPAKQRRVETDMGSAAVRRPEGKAWGAPPPRAGRSFGVEEMKKFDAVSDDRRDLPNRGDGTKFAPMNAKRPLRTLPDTADGRRRVYEYGPGPNIDPDPMAPFDPAALVGPAVDWGDERAAAGWEIARKDVRNLGRDGRQPYTKRPHSDMNG